jgi:glycosyltransferase involved in cell wall biosynthesis
MPVQVAVDAHNLALDDRGIGRYARAILSRALADADFAFTLVVRRMFPRAAPLARALGGIAVRVVNRVPRDAQVLWSPWNGTFLESHAPSVATVHDVGPFAFPSRSPRLRAAEQEPFRKTAAVAKRIIAPSRFTASEVERWLGVEAARIVVGPEAADAQVFAPGPSGPLPAGLHAGRFVLCVGTHEERKNTGPLIDAYARAFPDGDPPLVLTRRRGNLPRGAIVIESASDTDLVSLYRGATLVAAPSPYEGFGLPSLEALACGAPVLAARGGALVETCGEAVAWVDEPLRVEAWTRALRELVADDAARARLARLGPPRAAEFSWNSSAEQTLAVLRDVAEATC